MKSNINEKLSKKWLLYILSVILFCLCISLNYIDLHDFNLIRIVFGCFVFLFILLQNLVAENLLHTHWIWSIIYSFIGAGASGYSIYLGMSEHYSIKYVDYALKVSRHSKYIILRSFPISELEIYGWLMILIVFLGLALIIYDTHKSSKTKCNCN